MSQTPNKDAKLDEGRSAGASVNAQILQQMDRVLDQFHAILQAHGSADLVQHILKRLNSSGLHTNHIPASAFHGPKEFSGDAADVKIFVAIMKERMSLRAFASAEPCEKVAYFASFLTSHAALWHYGLQNSRSDILHDYDAYVAEFENHFNRAGILPAGAQVPQTQQPSRFRRMFASTRG